MELMHWKDCKKQLPVPLLSNRSLLILNPCLIPYYLYCIAYQGSLHCSLIFKSPGKCISIATMMIENNQHFSTGWASSTSWHGSSSESITTLKPSWAQSSASRPPGGQQGLRGALVQDGTTLFQVIPNIDKHCSHVSKLHHEPEGRPNQQAYCLQSLPGFWYLN